MPAMMIAFVFAESMTQQRDEVYHQKCSCFIVSPCPSRAISICHRRRCLWGEGPLTHLAIDNLPG